MSPLVKDPFQVDIRAAATRCERTRATLIGFQAARRRRDNAALCVFLFRISLRPSTPEAVESLAVLPQLDGSVL